MQATLRSPRRRRKRLGRHSKAAWWKSSARGGKIDGTSFAKLSCDRTVLAADLRSILWQTKWSGEGFEGVGRSGRLYVRSDRSEQRTAGHARGCGHWYVRRHAAGRSTSWTITSRRRCSAAAVFPAIYSMSGRTEADSKVERSGVGLCQGLLTSKASRTLPDRPPHCA